MNRDEITELQALLNNVGGLLEVDGVMGPATRRAIADARALAALATPRETEVPILRWLRGLTVRSAEATPTASADIDETLMEWLRAQPSPSPVLPTEGVVFIAKEEVSSRDYYDSHTSRPHWPGESSGITIGIGYDLRFSTDTFEQDWRNRLPEKTFMALRPYLGKAGNPAMVTTLSEIEIPWGTAWQVFIHRSLPVHVERTSNVYTTFDRLPGLCRSVLVSLVFNRGPAVEDAAGSDQRREMREIRNLLLSGNVADVPRQILSMSRLWPNSAGLRSRREREAELWRKGLSLG